MLIKFVFLCYFVFEISLCSPSNLIESKWSAFEIALKNQFKEFFENQNLINDLNKLLDRNYEANISQTCKTSLNRLVISLSKMETYAMQIFDASAKFPTSGLFEGTVTDLGQYDECLSIKIPADYTANQSQTGQYCTLRLRPSLPERPLFNTIHHQIPQLSRIIKNVDQNYTQWLSYLAANAQYFYFTPIRLGICTTSACSSLELNQIISYWFEKNFSLEAKISADGCETREQIDLTKKFGTKQWIAVGILSTFGILTLIGSLTDALNLNTTYQSSVFLIKRVIKQFDPIIQQPAENPKADSSMVTECKLFEYLDCFSIQRNLPLIVDISNSRPEKSFSIDVLHGIKVFAMSWVILGHTYGLINPENHEKIFVSTRIYSELLAQPFLNATLSVNTFFAVSGLLTSFTLLMNRKKMKNLMCFTMAFLFRAFRLLPSYIALICVTLLFAQMRSGPLWSETVQKPVIENCEQSYWTNLLFLNNFINTRQMCLMHTWYLSIDMQFYIVGLVCFFLLLRKTRLALLLILISGFIATLFCIIVTYFNNYPPTILASAPAVTERWYYILDFYYKPWCHLSSYFIGYYFGYALYLAQTGEQKIWLYKIYSNAISRNIASLLMTILSILTLFSTWPWNSSFPVPQLITAIYASTFRFCWSLSISWFIYVLTIERSGFIYRFLVWPGWWPISRLTYSAFLFHPLVIWIHFGTLEHRLSYNHMEFVRMFAANLILSLLLALISSLIFEAPIMALQRLLFKNSKKSSSPQ